MSKDWRTPSTPSGPPPDRDEPLEGELPFREPPPWERREELGFSVALFRTMKEVLVSPQEIFSRMQRTGGYGEPLFFAVLLGTVSVSVGVLLGHAYGGIPSIDPSSFSTENGYPALPSPMYPMVEAMGSLAYAVVTVGIVILSPLLIAAGEFISAGIIHLLLKLFGYANFDFEATFRASAYVSGSTTLFYLIPYCGGLIAFVWKCVCLIIALSKMHEISYGKAALVVLVPVLFCGCCFFIVLLIGIVGMEM